MGEGGVREREVAASGEVGMREVTALGGRRRGRERSRSSWGRGGDEGGGSSLGGGVKGERGGSSWEGWQLIDGGGVEERGDSLCGRRGRGSEVTALGGGGWG